MELKFYPIFQVIGQYMIQVDYQYRVNSKIDYQYRVNLKIDSQY